MTAQELFIWLLWILAAELAVVWVVALVASVVWFVLLPYTTSQTDFSEDDTAVVMLDFQNTLNSLNQW